MAEKRATLIDYIKEIPEGQKISVRNLAKSMSVSKGTAYRAIKAAEEMGLVETMPRSGTVRIAQTARSDEKADTLASEIKRLGLTVLCGAEHADIPLNRIILGDGSLEQFKKNVRSADGNVLCLVGDRPEILQEAISLGINVLTTGGARVSELQLMAAEQNGCCVMCTGQDSLLVYDLLRSECLDKTAFSPGDSARNWMQMPLYLYYNDIVADWHRLYRPIVSLFSRCAVVNDDLNICGTLDAVSAMSSTPSRKISSLYSSDVECFVADEDTSMQILAERLIKEGSAAAYITRGDTLCGIITSNDILKYYQYKNASGGQMSRGYAALELVNHGSQMMTSTYTAKVPETECGACESLFGILVSAARQHCMEKFKSQFSLTSGTFYSLEDCNSCNLIVTSEI
ncbi:MAG TPA: hypothetical protein DD735_09875, partial [Clostridiales bacterium]|nr:hypothetical protein [Clostridiales bacterium]